MNEKNLNNLIFNRELGMQSFVDGNQLRTWSNTVTYYIASGNIFTSYSIWGDIYR